MRPAPPGGQGEFAGDLATAIPRQPRVRLQTRSPLQYPQAQDERWESQHDHPIFKEEGSDMGLIEKERQGPERWFVGDCGVA